MSNVTYLTHHADPSRIAAAADRVRVDEPDLADLLAAVADALHTIGRPPLGDTEMLRWSAVVHRARRIATTRSPR